MHLSWSQSQCYEFWWSSCCAFAFRSRSSSLSKTDDLMCMIFGLHNTALNGPRSEYTSPVFGKISRSESFDSSIIACVCAVTNTAHGKIPKNTAQQHEDRKSTRLNSSH